MTMLKPRRLVVDDLKIKMLLYGEPGAGKTTLAAQAGDHPALAPVLFLNFEGGLLSVVERGDIDAVDINSMEDLEEVYESLRSGAEGFNHYNTIIIDSGSELYSQALVEATATGIDRDTRRGKTVDRSVDDTQLDDYGRAGKQVFRIFRAFRDLPYNLITTSTVRFTYPRNADKANTDPIDVGPSFSGQLGNQLLGLFDFVHYLYTAEDDEGETQRYLLTQKTGVYKAKTRGYTFAELLGGVVANPYLPDMYELLLQTGTSDARPEIRPMHAVDLHTPEEQEEIDGQDGIIYEPPLGSEPAYLPGSEEIAAEIDAAEAEKPPAPKMLKVTKAKGEPVAT